MPSGRINYSNFEYLNTPGKELNVNNFTEQVLLKSILEPLIHINALNRIEINSLS